MGRPLKGYYSHRHDDRGVRSGCPLRNQVDSATIEWFSPNISPKSRREVGCKRRPVGMFRLRQVRRPYDRRWQVYKCQRRHRQVYRLYG